MSMIETMKTLNIERRQEMDLSSLILQVHTVYNIQISRYLCAFIYTISISLIS